MKKLLPIIIFFLITNTVQASDVALTTPTFNNKIFNIKNYPNKTIIVNFWASWCVDCRKEMPVLEEIYKKNNVEIIGISIDSKREKNNAMKIAAEFSYPNSMLYEASEINIPEPDSIPTNYVIKNGKIIAKIIGYGESVTKQELEAALSK